MIQLLCNNFCNNSETIIVFLFKYSEFEVSHLYSNKNNLLGDTLFLMGCLNK